MVDDVQVSAGQAGVGGNRRRVFDSYGRLSRVPGTGELEKIETQLADNRKVIERLGAVVGQELSDGMSAWRKGARRAGWEALLERVRSGESDGCVVWHTDRLFRQPRDLETLIDLADKGYTVASAHGARDLADPDDRFILRIEVAHAARSSDDTSRRIKRRFEAIRANGDGNTGGLRRFGFPGLEFIGSGPAGERLPVSAEQVERERAALREAVAGLLDGSANLSSVARDWNTAGLASPRGLIWALNSVRETLKRPALGGWIVHEGVIVGRMDGEPILDEDTYDRLVAWSAGRKRGRPPGERYVGPGILRCGRCQRKMVGRKCSDNPYSDGTQRRVYYCAKQRRGCGRTAIDMPRTDAVLRELTVTRLADPAHAATLEADETSARLAVVREEIRQIEQLQHALSERLGNRQITLAAFDAANEPLAADLLRLGAERGELAATVAPLSTDNADGTDGGVDARVAARIGRDWDNADAVGKRAMLLRALGRNRVEITPGGKRGQFDPERIRIIPPTNTTDTEPNGPVVANGGEDRDGKPTGTG